MHLKTDFSILKCLKISNVVLLNYGIRFSCVLNIYLNIKFSLHLCHIHDCICHVRLGRGGNVVGRGSGGCRIHDSISSMQLGRTGDARTTHKTLKTPRKQMVTDGRTDRQWLIESRARD